ncbi:MAG TPA: carbohydrate kinase family protein [Clostridiaceae bacterium]|nr:carbohydrate kinase family protein [Clostridiaceae bacterium]
MNDVLCIGRMTSCDIIFTELQELPELGKEIFCKDLVVKPGGAANTPMALAKLGIKTALLTVLGNDLFGNIIFEYIKQTGVDMSAVHKDNKYRTCVSAVLSTGRERGFVTFYDESKYSFKIEDIEQQIKNSMYIYSDIITCIELPIVEIAKKYKKNIFLDTCWNENIKLDKIKHLLEQIDTFMPNEIEACYITDTDDVELALQRLGQYTNTVVIKLGNKGSIAKQKYNVVRTPSIKGLKPIDTTGAGDLFNAGFIYGCLKGLNLEDSLRIANITGGLAVTFIGGVDESFTIEQVMKYFNSSTANVL